MGKYLSFWLLPIFVLMSVFTVWVRLSVVRTSYEIDQLDKMSKNARQEMEHLELEVAELSSPERLKKLAIKKYHLSSPSTDRVIYLEGKK